MTANTHKKTGLLRPLVTGLVTVLAVVGLGFGLGLATGVVTPESAFAVLDGSGGCCIVHWDGGGGGLGGGFTGGWVDGGGGGGGWEPPEPPYCELSASPSTVSQNGQTTLTWSTYNATSASIDHGIGSVTPVQSGSVNATVGQTTTYTMTVHGGLRGQRTATCSTTVTVPPPAQGCIRVLKETFNPSGQPITPVAQFTFALDGGVTTQNDANGDAIFMNVAPGLHQVTETVPSGWTQLSVTPINGYVYVTASETCAAVVFKNKQNTPPPNAPTCTFSASPDAINSGEATTLTWTTTNATQISIDEDVDGPLVPIPGGNITAHPTENTTYHFTATGPGGSVTCEDTVTVTPPPAPGCIRVLKETFNTQGNPITPVAQFEFKLDGDAQTAYNDAGGNAIFTNVAPGTHTVTEIVPPTWQQLSVTPASGIVQVAPGETCAAVVFKNKQVITTPPPITIHATKIVCEHESDLPNYGAGGPNINAATATDYVANHPGCHLESGWTFEWAQANVANPGDNTGAGGASWNPFATTDGNGVATIAIPFESITGNKIWVREQWDDDYIPFKGTVMDSNSAELYCHTDVLNYDNYDFVTSPVAGQTYYCVAWNVPKPPPPGTPQCTLEADPTTIDEGGSSTLTWTTTNVTSASINNGVGTLSPVSGGTVSVSPETTTTYTLTGTGPGGDVTCAKTVYVHVPPPTPVCHLQADKASIEDGDEVTLSWTSSNAHELFFNQGIGSTTPVTGGSLVVSPDEDTTYTGIWYGETETVTCSVSIAVDQDGLSCEMNVSPSTINKGENASLSWGGVNVTSVSIDNGIGNRSVPGSETVSPGEAGTYTYHGEFTTGDNQTIHCSATLEVKNPSCTENCGGGGGGGGSRKPRVTFKAFEPEGEVLGSYVYLSQVPYTGLDLGPLGTVFYWLMLGVWSAAAAYLVLFNFLPFAYRRLSGLGKGVHDVLNKNMPAPVYAMPTSAVVAPSGVLPGALDEIPDATQGYSTFKGFRSFAHNNHLSVDDIVRGLARMEEPTPASYERVNEHTVLQSDAATSGAYDNNRPHEAYDAWQSASMGRNVEPIYTSVEPIEPTIPRPAYQNVGQSKAIETHGIHDADVHGFLDALLAADREATFGFLRQMTRSGIAVEKFLTRALHALDDAFRARVEGGTCDPEVLRITGKCSTPAIENLVTALTHAVDGSYSKGMTGAKLALTRALDSLEA